MSVLVTSLQCHGSMEPLFLLLISCKLIIISLNCLNIYTGQAYLPKRKEDRRLLTSGFLHTHTYI